jgi:hypothetical protein
MSEEYVTPYQWRRTLPLVLFKPQLSDKAIKTCIEFFVKVVNFSIPIKKKTKTTMETMKP